MPFRRSFGGSIRPVHRIKHVFDQQAGGLAGTVATFTIVNTVDAPILANTSEVETGSKINGIYIKLEVSATSAGALANIYMMVAKNPGNNLTFPNPNVVGADDNKKYVFHQEMVMVQKVNPSNPRTLFNGVVVIPKGYRRNGPNDRIIVVVFSPGVNTDICIQCHYKEFR